jgi:hypothetical protein
VRDRAVNTILFFVGKGIQIFDRGIQNNTGVFKSHKARQHGRFRYFCASTVGGNKGREYENPGKPFIPIRPEVRAHHRSGNGV